MRNLFKITLCLIAVSACSGNYYKMPLPEVDKSKYENLGTATSTATGISLFGFIPIQLNNKIERATQSAITSKGGDMITDVTVRERWYWAYVLNMYKVDLTGTVLKKK